MSSSESQSSAPPFALENLSLQKLPLDPELLLGLAAGPFLGALMFIQAAGQTVVELGQVSEELFRGDRLPILPNPESGKASDEVG